MKRTDTIPHYDLEALRQNVIKCDKNITLFHEAIQKELENRYKLLQLIKGIEEAKV